MVTLMRQFKSQNKNNLENMYRFGGTHSVGAYQKRVQIRVESFATLGLCCSNNYLSDFLMGVQAPQVSLREGTERRRKEFWVIIE